MTNDQIGFETLGYFLYRSTASDGLKPSDLEDILSVARARNAAGGLTGCLHYEDGLFFQWLEGPVSSLKPIVASIMQDVRHRDVTVLGEGNLGHRRFQCWHMRFSDRDRASLMDWFAGSGVSTVDRGDYAVGVTAFLEKVSI